jgi:hypothetical protein
MDVFAVNKFHKVIWHLKIQVMPVTDDVTNIGFQTVYTAPQVLLLSGMYETT